MSILNLKTARVFEPLLHPSRYRGAYGGRGSGKSHFFAEKLIEDHLCYPGLRSVGIREVQKSLRDSARLLLADKIQQLNVGKYFSVHNDHIKAPGSGIIVFQGMQDHTAESIKSLEGFNRAWIEEAQTVSARSLQLLRPTIRNDTHPAGAEIWASWNPRFDTDPIDVLLRGDDLPTGATVVRANWSDNPWFPEVLEQERLDCLRMYPDQYDHIWEGGYITVIDGAYYASQLNTARLDGRITKVPIDPLLKVRLFCDIGGAGRRSDAFSIWAAQFVGKAVHYIDYYEAEHQTIDAHVEWLTSRGYTPNRASIWLPHDGDTSDRVYDVSYKSAFAKSGYDVTVVPNQGSGAAKGRIDAARLLFHAMWFDEERCKAGLRALGWYHEKRDAMRGIGLGPNHDWSSHAADSFGLSAICHKPPEREQPRIVRRRPIRDRLIGF